MNKDVEDGLREVRQRVLEVGALASAVADRACDLLPDRGEGIKALAMLAESQAATALASLDALIDQVEDLHLQAV